MRGEHLEDWEEKPLIVGSPPHARGTRDSDRCYNSVTGITPACAGNTRKFLVANEVSEDHPRMRGEHVR